MALDDSYPRARNAKRMGWLLLALFVGLASAAVGEEAAASDPIAREVVRLLQAEVPETVILQWLEASERNPGILSSEDLIALRRAGASEALLRDLLERGGKPAPSTPAAPGAPAAPAERPGVQAAPPAAPQLVPPASPSSAAVKTRFDLQYQPLVREDEEPWDLFVYLDGRPLARAEAGMLSVVGKKPLSFERDLAPGLHVLRLVQERHVSRSGKRSWRHEARVSPDAVSFALSPGEPGRVELTLRQATLALRRTGGPLSFRVSQGDREVSASEKSGADPDGWPLLCEEIEANLDPGKKPPLPIRRQLEECVRWETLWPGISSAPSRAEVRAELERYGFKPVAQ